MEDRYIPVNSGFYEELEALADARKPCEVVFRNGEAKSVIRGKAVDVYSQEGMDFLEMESGIKIRLDKLIQVNNIFPTQFC